MLILVLSTCSHGGLVKKDFSKRERYGIEILEEHYTCVIDMLCRSGWNIEAYELLTKIPTDITNSEELCSTTTDNAKISELLQLEAILVKFLTSNEGIVSIPYIHTPLISLKH